MESLQICVDRFHENVLALKAQFFEDRSLLPYLSALLPTAAGHVPAPEALRESGDMLRQLDDRFDSLSGQSAPLLVAGAALSQQPERFLFSAANAYRVLKSSFLASPHLIPAAYLLTRFCADSTDYDNVARRAARLHSRIGDVHPFLTGYEDIPVCILYALQPDAEARIGEIERCAERLKPLGCKRNTLQSLSHIAALYQSPDDACTQMCAIGEQLCSMDLHLGSGTPLLGLGALGQTDAPPERAAAAIGEISALLGQKNGFSMLEIGHKNRLMLSCLLWGLLCCAPQPPLAAAVLSVFAENLSDQLL